MAKGDHIKVKKVVRLKKPVRLKTIGYWHHGIDCGDGTVIHFRHGLIKRTSMQYFLGRRRRKGIVVRHRYSFPADKVVARAEMCLGRKGYNLLFNNCEHFAHWCKTGRKRSKQVNKAAYRAGTAATTTAVGISVGLGPAAVIGVAGCGIAKRSGITRQMKKIGRQISRLKKKL